MKRVYRRECPEPAVLKRGAAGDWLHRAVGLSASRLFALPTCSDATTAGHKEKTGQGKIPSPPPKIPGPQFVSIVNRLLIRVRNVRVARGKLLGSQTEVRTAMLGLRLAGVEQIMPTLVLVVSHIANLGREIVDNRHNRCDRHAKKECLHLIAPSFAICSPTFKVARANQRVKGSNRSSSPPPASSFRVRVLPATASGCHLDSLRLKRLALISRPNLSVTSWLAWEL